MHFAFAVQEFLPVKNLLFLHLEWKQCGFLSSVVFPFITKKTNSLSSTNAPQPSFTQRKFNLAVLKLLVATGLYFCVLFFIFYRNENALNYCLLHYYIKFIEFEIKMTTNKDNLSLLKSSTTAGGMSWLNRKQQQKKNSADGRKSEKTENKAQEALTEYSGSR